MIREIVFDVIDWEDLKEKIKHDVEDIRFDMETDNKNATDNEIAKMTKEHIKHYIDDCYYSIKYLTYVIQQMNNPPERVNIDLFNEIFKYEGYDGFSDYVIQFV